jgi:uncharacterized lipoprotein YddW (UPF0748 family)
LGSVAKGAAPAAARLGRRGFLERVAEALSVAYLPTGWRRERPLAVWVWVHGEPEASADEWRHRFARVQAAGVSGVLLGGDTVAAAAAAANALGLHVHRWTWILNRSGDAWVKAHHPEWFSVSREGRSSLDHPPYVGYYQWLCPSRAPVREYLRGMIREVARTPGVQGVHFDYVRYPDVILPRGLWEKYDLVQDREYPQFDFCYCDVCRAAFRRQRGQDPLRLADPPSDAAWRRFRWDSVTRLVRELAATVHSEARQVSAAVFPTPAIARRLVRQAWDEWPLDAVFPMIYQNFYDEAVSWIGTATREDVAAVPRNRPVFAGLYVPGLAADDLGQAVRLARAAGAAGVSLFDLGALTDQHLISLRQALAA